MEENTRTPEDRRTHLEFIQAIIQRMSKASSQIKTWLLPIITASYAYAAINTSWHIALLGILITIPALYMDCRYLLTEQDYRHLYNAIVEGSPTVPLYSLNPKEILPKEDKRQRAWHTLKSWSIWPFYLSIFLVGVLAIIFAVCGK